MTLFFILIQIKNEVEILQINKIKKQLTNILLVFSY